MMLILSVFYVAQLNYGKILTDTNIFAGHSSPTKLFSFISVIKINPRTLMNVNK